MASNSKAKKSTSQFIEKNNKQVGGIESKDDPDKLDKEEYQTSEEEDVDDEEVEEGEEVEEVEEEEEDIEKEETDKEKDEEEEIGDDECVYKLTKPGKSKISLDVEIDIIEDNFEDEESETTESKYSNNYVKDNERKTKPFLFEFERVRLLSERARQLSLGAKSMIKDIDNIEKMNPKIVAKLELEKKIIPLIILRELPNGLIEKWKVSELKYF